MASFTFPQATEEQPEFPIVTRTYYVECMFLEDFQARVLSAQSKDVASLLTDKETGDLEKDSGVSLLIIFIILSIW